MTGIITIILLILLVIGGMFLSLRITGWKMKKAWEFIVLDLKERKAFNPATAVELPYTKGPMLSLGFRDYRSPALQELLKHDVVRAQEGERYYLREGSSPEGQGDRASI